MAEGKLKTVWEHHRENRIPYPENMPDWVEYAMWYQLCDTMEMWKKKAEASKKFYQYEGYFGMAACYERLAHAFLEGHIRAQNRDSEQGMSPEVIAEMNGVKPDDPQCVAKWVWDLSPSTSSLDEFRAKKPYSGAGDTVAEMKYFGFEPTSEHTDPAFIRKRAVRLAELWSRYPNDLSKVDMREWVILSSDRSTGWLHKFDPEIADEINATIEAQQKALMQHFADGSTRIGRYLAHRRAAKAEFLRGNWNEAMSHVNSGHYHPIHHSIEERYSRAWTAKEIAEADNEREEIERLNSDLSWMD